jgi:Nif-specific regulatory protein
VKTFLDLARHFVSRYAAESGRRLCTLSSACEQMLEHHDWPGNVRELQNVIERAIVLSQTGILLPGDFPPYLHKTAGGGRDPGEESSNDVSGSETPWIESLAQETSDRAR